MRVLTFGWDFPPSRNGGLGVACFGLTRELFTEGVEVIFVLPKKQETIGTPKFVFAGGEYKTTVIEVNSAIAPYQSGNSLVTSVIGHYVDGAPKYATRTMLEEVRLFAKEAAHIARTQNFDIIHAHDWTSYLAGMVAKEISGKPLVLHVHATSFDQAASNNVDPDIFRIEQDAFNYTDKVVAVSEFTRRIIIEKHRIDPAKVEVVHNGCDTFVPPTYEPTLKELKAQGKKIILYHGRITIQKGVDYFIKAARRVVDVDPNIVFVISGWGDMQNQIIRMVGELGLSGHVIFAGALWEEERDRMYQSADLVVMPSVSEPFGLVPLEAMQHGTPSLISKQSGVSEILTHVLKIDFWDVDGMANHILAAMRYDVLRTQLKSEGRKEINRLSWREAAKKVLALYKNLVNYISA